MDQRWGNLTLGHPIGTCSTRDKEILPWVISQLGQAWSERGKLCPGTSHDLDKLGKRQWNLTLGHLSTGTRWVRDGEILSLVIQLGHGAPETVKSYPGVIQRGQGASETGKSYPGSYLDWDKMCQETVKSYTCSSNLYKVHQRQENLNLGHISIGTRWVRDSEILPWVIQLGQGASETGEILPWVIGLGQAGSETEKSYPGSSDWERQGQIQWNLTLGHPTGRSCIRDWEILPWYIPLKKAGSEKVKSYPGRSNWDKLGQRQGNLTRGHFSTETSLVRDWEILHVIQHSIWY